MTVVPFIKIEKLLEYLEIEVREVLLSHRLYSLSGYAWQDENTPSEEFIGLAKWELESPGESIDVHGDAIPVEERARLIALETAGEDFRGLMEMSRMSIGFAMFYSGLAKKSPFELHDPFWMHHLNAMTMLSMASDRLRDVFLTGCFKQTAKEYKKGRPDEAKHYAFPFADAMCQSFAGAYHTEIVKLFVLASDIFDKGIERRNELVHELATRLGRLAKDTTGKRQNWINRDWVPDFDESRKAWDETNRLHEAEIEGSVQMLVDWYLRLVRAAALVCDIEHTMRLEGLKKMLLSDSDRVKTG